MELAEKGRLDYLVSECLAERTLALAQQEKRRAPSRGYDPLLEARSYPATTMLADARARALVPVVLQGLATG